MLSMVMFKVGVGDGDMRVEVDRSNMRMQDGLGIWSSQIIL